MSVEYVTRVELAEAVAPLATKAELAEAIAPLATKAELAEAIAPLTTRAELQEVRTELKQEIQALRVDFDARFTEMRAEFDSKFVELRHHFDVTVEAIRAEIRAIAEICLATNAKVDKLRREMRRRFRKQDERIDRIDADVYLLKQRMNLIDGGRGANPALTPSS